LTSHIKNLFIRLGNVYIKANILQVQSVRFQYLGMSVIVLPPPITSTQIEIDRTNQALVVVRPLLRASWSLHHINLTSSSSRRRECTSRLLPTCSTYCSGRNEYIKFLPTDNTLIIRTRVDMSCLFNAFTPIHCNSTVSSSGASITHAGPNHRICIHHHPTSEIANPVLGFANIGCTRTIFRAHPITNRTGVIW